MSTKQSYCCWPKSKIMVSISCMADSVGSVKLSVDQSESPEPRFLIFFYQPNSRAMPYRVSVAL
uniref:Uncharacterized protein n=1 Tax=Anguilla anguilla TaxID=7936 RepID=A0A0E9X203_ANGAN